MERFFAEKFGRGKLSSFAELIRPWNSIIVILFSLLGLFFTNYDLLSFWQNALLLCIIVFLMYSASTSANDIFDLKTDNVNMPFRPLQRGSLRIREVAFFCFISYSVALILSLSISVNFFISIILMFVSSITYSIPPFSVKNRGIIGNFSLAFSSVFTTMYAGHVLLTDNLILPMTPLLEILSLVSLFMFFSILKDFKDHRGDKIAGKKTLPVSYGLKIASKINIIGTSVSFLTAIFLFYQKFQNIVFLLVSGAIFILLIFIEFDVYKNPKEKTGENAWSKGRLIILFFVLSLFLFS